MGDVIQSVIWTLDGEPSWSGHYLPFDEYHAADELLYDALEEQLPATYDEAFLPTKPRWYGFWATSPLTYRQIQLLIAFLSNVDARMPGRCSESHKKFLAALREAARTNRVLHVKLPPPGHADFGMCTTYVHCPRCKAAGPFEPSQESYPVAEMACEVCGFQYSPAATYTNRQNRLYVEETIHCKSCTIDVPSKEFSNVELDRLEAAVEWNRMKLHYEIWRDMSDEDLEMFRELNGREINRAKQLQQIQDKMTELNEMSQIDVPCPRCHCRVSLG